MVVNLKILKNKKNVMNVDKKEYMKKYREENKEKIKEQSKKWREYNKDYVKKERIKYREENKEKYTKSKKKSDKKYRDKEENKEKRRKYTEENRDKIKKQSKKWREDNKEHIKEYGIKNRERYNKRRRERRKEDDLFRLKDNLRSRISQSFGKNGYKKSSRIYEILGCSYDLFKQYIEMQFKEWMNYENQGKYNGEFYYGWDLDHIIPISSAKCEDDMIKLNHYTNFQPLCSKINRDIKRDNK